MKDNPKLRLAPVVSGELVRCEFPGFQDPIQSRGFHDKRVREAISLAIDRDAIDTRPSAAAWAWRTATGSTTTSNCSGMEWPKWPHDHRQGESS